MGNEDYMKLALEEAAKGAGYTDPNPLVGAIIVKHGRIIGTGHHRRFGGPHAEIEALCDCRRRGGDAVGADLYVTLEPCCHHGKTPPCTDALSRSGLARVIIGTTDPNPAVAGRGIEILRQQGIAVETGVLEAECRRQNEIYFHGLEHHTPFVLMKYAMTADGKIAAVSGSSQWITGLSARAHTHRTRTRCTAIMVGSGTVLADNPSLTSHGGGRDPDVIVCDSRLRTPPDCALLSYAGTRTVYLATVSSDRSRIRALEDRGAVVLSTKEQDGRVDLNDLMIRLYQRGIYSILLEGGGTLNYSALSSGIVRRLHLYVGAQLFGGASALSPVEGAGIRDLAQAYSLTLESTEVLGDDIFVDYRVRRPTCLPE